MLETASKLIHNWRCYPSSKCCKIDQKTRLWIGRSAVAPSDAAEKNRNIDVQQHSLRCTTATKLFRKIYFLYDFWCAQTCSFRAIFWTTRTEVWHLLLALYYVATCGKKLYRCTSTFSALNYCGGIFFKTLRYLYEVVCTIFSADFWTFRKF